MIIPLNKSCQFFSGVCVADIFCTKVEAALVEQAYKALVFVGGVAGILTFAKGSCPCTPTQRTLFFTCPRYCTDNADSICWALKSTKGEFDNFDFDIL